MPAEHIILECVPLHTRRRWIFRGKQPGAVEDAGLERRF